MKLSSNDSSFNELWTQNEMKEELMIGLDMCLQLAAMLETAAIKHKNEYINATDHLYAVLRIIDRL